MGILGLTLHEGGLTRFQETVRVLATVHDPGLVSTFAINEIALKLLSKFREQLEPSIIDELTSGRANVALSMSEVEAGSDVAGITAPAVRDRDGFVLNGEKAYISNGPISQYFIVAMRTNDSAIPALGISLFLVRRDDPGVTVTTTETVGIPTMPLGNLTMTDVRIPENRLLGQINRGFVLLMNILGFERVIVAVLATAMGHAHLIEGARHCRERHVFGKSLADLQHTQMIFARLGSRLRSLESFVDDLIKGFDSGNRIDKDEAIMAKVLSTELLVDIALELGQLYGAQGFFEGHWIANLVNDVRWTGIAGGSNQVLLGTLGKHFVYRAQN